MEDVAKSGWTVDKKDGNHWTDERSDSLAGNCNQTFGNNFAQRNEERNEQSNEQCKKGEYRRSKKGKESKVEWMFRCWYWSGECHTGGDQIIKPFKHPTNRTPWLLCGGQIIKPFKHLTNSTPWLLYQGVDFNAQLNHLLFKTIAIDQGFWRTNGRTSWKQEGGEEDEGEGGGRGSVGDVRPGEHRAGHQRRPDHPDCSSSTWQVWSAKFQQVCPSVLSTHALTSLTNVPWMQHCILCRTGLAGSLCPRCRSTGGPPWCTVWRLRMAAWCAVVKISKQM